MRGQSKQVRQEDTASRPIRYAKKSGDMYADLREHLRTYSGSPVDDFIVENIKYHIEELNRARKNDDTDKYDKYFRVLLGLFKDIGVLPRQFIELKRKVQLTDSYNDGYAEEKRKELIKGNNEKVDL